MNDLKLACRQLLQHPVQSLMLTGILSVGIAGTTSVFSLFNTVFLQPLPIPDQDRVVNLDEFDPAHGNEQAVPYPRFYAWRRDNRTFESMAFSSQWGANASHNGVTEHTGMRYVTHEFFEVLGIHPLLGRTFTADEDRPGGPKVVLLGEGLWKRLFDGDPNVIGQNVSLDDDPSWTVIGVLPDSTFPDRKGLWCPLAADPANNAGGLGPMAVGRLKPGVTLEQAPADLTRIQQGWAEQHPDQRLKARPKVTPVREAYLRMANAYRFVLFVTLGVAGLVLVIACCNAASAMLAQGVQQSHEFAVRATLGATRGRIVRQVLAQSLVLGVAGSAAGVVLGGYALRGLVRLLGDIVPTWMHFSLDFRSVLFCLFVLAVTTLLSGLLPALQAAAPGDLRSTLQAQGTRNPGSRTRRRTLDAIIVAQVALAMTLLGGAGLILRTYLKVQDTDPGFRTKGVLTFNVQLPIWPYLDENKRRVFWDEYLEKVRALPGVEHAALINLGPMPSDMTFSSGARFSVEGESAPPDNESHPYAITWKVSPDYFAVLDIPLLAGRAFTEQDNRPGREKTAVVDETFARKCWPNESPVGKRVRPDGSREWVRVIGVVKDTRQVSLDQSPQPSVFEPVANDPGFGECALVQSPVDPRSLLSSIRTAIRSLDPGVAVEDVKTLAQRVRESMSTRRLVLWLYGAPALVATLLAFAGLYGVTAYSVTRRTQEIGIRMALGARLQDVTKMVLVQGFRLIAVGLALGLFGAVALGRVLASMGFMLYHVGYADPLSFASVAVLLAVVAALACYLPARKAAKVDPMVALRNE